MNIDGWKNYKMRNGNLAVVEVEHKEEPIYQFSGKCFDANGNLDRIAYWMSSGRYSVHLSEFDIIEQAPNAKVTGSPALSASPRGQPKRRSVTSTHMRQF